MLVTTRHPGESVIITVPPGDKPQRITVKLIQVRGDRVRLGFDAPREIEVHREEVQRDIDAGVIG